MNNKQNTSSLLLLVGYWGLGVGGGCMKWVGFSGRASLNTKNAELSPPSAPVLSRLDFAGRQAGESRD